jgi:hypothetical protein
MFVGLEAAQKRELAETKRCKRLNFFTNKTNKKKQAAHTNNNEGMSPRCREGMGGGGRGRRGVEAAEEEEVWRFGGLEEGGDGGAGGDGGLPVDPDPHGVSVGPQPTEGFKA